MRNHVANYGYYLPIIIITIGAYTLLHQNLNIYYEDDSWTTSVVYNIFVNDIHKDTVFLDDSAVTQDQLFGILYSYISGSFLSLLGWTKSNVYLLSSIFIFLSSLVWHAIVRQLPVNHISQKYLSVLLPIFPPVFFAAHTGRPDGFTFLIMSIGILLFIKNYKLLAGIFLVLAMESHLIGVITGFYYIGYFVYEWERSNFNKSLLTPTFMSTSAGALIGLLIYGVLHINTFSMDALVGLIRTKTDMVSPVNNYILSYFTDFDWYSHIPEFLLLGVSTVVYIKHKLYTHNRFLLILLITLLVSTFITRRENRNYFLFISPVVILFYLETFSQIKRPQLIINSLVAIGLFYFLIMYHKNQSFKFDNFVELIRTSTEEDLPIVGMPDVWFAAYDRDFIPIHNERNFNNIYLDSFYLIETDYLKDRSRSYSLVQANIHKNYKCQQIRTWHAFDNNNVQICKCKDDSKPNIPLVYKTYPGWQSVVKTYLSASLDL